MAAFVCGLIIGGFIGANLCLIVFTLINEIRFDEKEKDGDE